MEMARNREIKPHIRRYRDGWHAKLGLSNAIGKTPKDAFDELVKFIAGQRE